MSSTITPQGATGIGTQQLDFAIGPNQTRDYKTYTCSLSAFDGDIQGGELVITQGFTALSNTYESVNTSSLYATNSAQQVTFTGVANGKYLRYSSLSDGISVICNEYSIGYGAAVNSEYGHVTSFVGGSTTYEYSVVFPIPAQSPGGTFSVTIDTSDTPDGAIAESVTYSVTVLKTSMTINGDDAVATADASNTATYSVTYLPSGTSQTGCTWSVSKPDQVSITSEGVLTITDTTASNLTVRITATNTYDSSVVAHKDIIVSYVSTQNDYAFEFANLQNSDISKPAYVSVTAEDTNDFTPEITMRTVPAASISNITPTIVSSASGANLTATINRKQQKVYTTFSANSSSTSRTIGTVLLTYNYGGEEFSRTITYNQAAKPADLDKTSMSIVPGSFSMSSSNGTLTASFSVEYGNANTTKYQFKGLSGTIVGYNSFDGPSDGEVLFTRNVSVLTNEVSVDASSDGNTWVTVMETYSDSWSWDGDWNDVLRIDLEWKHGSKHIATARIFTRLESEE